MTKKIITLSLDSDIIDTLKKLANGNSSRYANQMLRKVLGLEDIDESDERIAAIEDFLSERMGYQKRINKTKGAKFAK